MAYLRCFKSADGRSDLPSDHLVAAFKAGQLDSVLYSHGVDDGHVSVGHIPGDLPAVG